MTKRADIIEHVDLTLIPKSRAELAERNVYHVHHMGVHFNYIGNVGDEDFKTKEYFMSEQINHQHVRGKCGPVAAEGASSVENFESDADARDEEEDSEGDSSDEREIWKPKREKKGERRGRKALHTEAELQQLVDGFRCGCGIDGMKCESVLACGDAFKVMKESQGEITNKQKVLFIRRALTAALRWDEDTREWCYNLTINYVDVCAKTWRFCHLYSRSVFYRVKASVEKLAGEARYAGGIRVEGRVQCHSENRNRYNTVKARNAIAFLQYYSEECGEKMPLPEGSCKRKHKGRADEGLSDEDEEYEDDEDGACVMENDTAVQIRVPQVMFT